VATPPLTLHTEWPLPLSHCTLGGHSPSHTAHCVACHQARFENVQYAWQSGSECF